MRASELLKEGDHTFLRRGRSRSTSRSAGNNDKLSAALDYCTQIYGAWSWLNTTTQHACTGNDQCSFYMRFWLARLLACSGCVHDSPTSMKNAVADARCGQCCMHLAAGRRGRPAGWTHWRTPRWRCCRHWAAAPAAGTQQLPNGDSAALAQFCTVSMNSHAECFRHEQQVAALASARMARAQPLPAAAAAAAARLWLRRLTRLPRPWRPL